MERETHGNFLDMQRDHAINQLWRSMAGEGWDPEEELANLQDDRELEKRLDPREDELL
jgi:hypothetical protein